MPLLPRTFPWPCRLPSPRLTPQVARERHDGGRTARAETREAGGAAAGLRDRRPGRPSRVCRAVAQPAAAPARGPVHRAAGGLDRTRRHRPGRGVPYGAAGLPPPLFRHRTGQVDGIIGDDGPRRETSEASAGGTGLPGGPCARGFAAGPGHCRASGRGLGRVGRCHDRGARHREGPARHRRVRPERHGGTVAGQVDRPEAADQVPLPGGDDQRHTQAGPGPDRDRAMAVREWMADVLRQGTDRA